MDSRVARGVWTPRVCSLAACPGGQDGPASLDDERASAAHRASGPNAGSPGVSKVGPVCGLYFRAGPSGVITMLLHIVVVAGIYVLMQTFGQLPGFLDVDYAVLRRHPALLEAPGPRTSRGFAKGMCDGLCRAALKTRTCAAGAVLLTLRILILRQCHVQQQMVRRHFAVPMWHQHGMTRRGLDAKSKLFDAGRLAITTRKRRDVFPRMCVPKCSRCLCIAHWPNPPVVPRAGAMRNTGGATQVPPGGRLGRSPREPYSL